MRDFKGGQRLFREVNVVWGRDQASKQAGGNGWVLLQMVNKGGMGGCKQRDRGWGGQREHRDSGMHAQRCGDKGAPGMRRRAQKQVAACVIWCQRGVWLRREAVAAESSGSSGHCPAAAQRTPVLSGTPTLNVTTMPALRKRLDRADLDLLRLRPPVGCM